MNDPLLNGNFADKIFCRKKTENEKEKEKNTERKNETQKQKLTVKVH